MSLFKDVEAVPLDAIFLVKQNYEKDPFEKKVDVGIGAYRDNSGKPYVLEAVKEAERLIKDENHEYLPIGGLPSFISATRSFAFGNESQSLKNERIATVQSLSGTGALRLGMDFIFQCFGDSKTVLISTPTWGNHRDICTRSRLTFSSYRYWKQESKGLDFEGMMEDLRSAANGSVVLLHMCAHNPTGVDPTKEQWQEILQLCKEKEFLPFFDAAYQGFASGDCDGDAYSLRLFEEAGLELLLAQSYSKNVGLYGERVGALNVVCKRSDVARAIESQLRKIIRAMYSNPPKHGALIVSTILNTPELKQKWLKELSEISARIQNMRKELRGALEDIGAEGDWSFITTQIGMFTYTGLKQEQVEEIQREFHIYMPNSGRISIAGLNDGNVKYVADAIKSVL